MRCHESPEVRAAPHCEPAVHAHAVFVALLQHDIDDARVDGMDRDGKAKAGGQAPFADVDPILAHVVAAIDAAVVLLEQHLRVGGMQCHLVDALPVFGVLIGAEIGADVAVARRPGLPAVIAAIASARGDRDIHAGRVIGIEQDGMQAQAAIAGEPGAAVRVIEERLVQIPGLAAVTRDEQGGRLGAGIQDARLQDARPV